MKFADLYTYLSAAVESFELLKLSRTEADIIILKAEANIYIFN